MERILIVGQKSPSQARLIGSLSLGLRCGGYRDDHPTRIKLGCSTVLSHQSDGLCCSIWWRNKVLNAL